MFSIRTWGRDANIAPIQQPNYGRWPPLHIEKRHCPCQDEKKKKRRRLWTILLVIILIYLLANTTFLNVRVVTMQPSSSSSQQKPPPSSGTSTPTTLSADAQQCLSQFTLNAPANPSSYPCSSCLPVLQGVPESFANTDPQDGQSVQNAIQFCGLKAIFDSADSTGQTALGNGNWVKDIKFCAWSGVSCDGVGLVSAIQLTFPGVPAAIPQEVGSLAGLQNFQVIGNNAVPGGSLPSTFTNITSLATLHLESTGMSALPDGLFSSLKKVTTLALLKNQQFGGALPSSVTQLSLQSLIVNSQPLSAPLTTLLSSTTLQSSLLVLDLSGTGLATPIPPSISAFTSLKELHLDNNNLQPPLPALPTATLQTLSLSNNTALNGAIPAGVCASAALKSCNLHLTGLGGSGTCGSCQF
ncbi:L domain-like protein [Rickenella mellea]|uniref:L domain-like protein n=1 Tax=Rickenella mellea TaxID=50990 RepID=A0A4Y7Q713_9AGAM|nr:L domain-like protein [Rickenella mellea]